MSEKLDIYDKNRQKTNKTIYRDEDVLLNDNEFIVALRAWVINYENKILFTIETDEDSVMESLNEKVNSTVATVCEELNVKETLNVVKSKSVDNLVARALELDPTLTEEEARQMETKELLK